MGDTFKAERTTQICIDKIISVTKGDEIQTNYVKDSNGKIIYSTISINGEQIGRFSLEELEEFLSIFLQNPI